MDVEIKKKLQKYYNELQFIDRVYDRTIGFYCEIGLLDQFLSTLARILEYTLKVTEVDLYFVHAEGHCEVRIYYD